MSIHLESPFNLSGLALKNRLVMAPLTRCRAIGNVANDLMAKYYAQRAEAGLIVAEGTAPSPNGLGYARIPGLFHTDHVVGWKKVTDAVHKAGSKIFVQLMHTGRVSQQLNLPVGARVLAPSTIPLEGSMWTDQQGKQPYTPAIPMSDADVNATIGEYVHAGKLALEAGFDGVELHGANGYLIEQFLNPTTNTRSDAWGGDATRRNAFALDIAKKLAQAIGPEKVGIRLSPYGVFNGQQPFVGLDEQYTELASGLSAIGLAYIHLVDHSAMGAPPVPAAIKQKIRTSFKQCLILCGGYNFQSANADLAAEKADLIAMGRPFIANPKLLTTLKSGAEQQVADVETFYTADEKGYTTYN